MPAARIPCPKGASPGIRTQAATWTSRRDNYKIKLAHALTTAGASADRGTAASECACHRNTSAQGKSCMERLRPPPPRPSRLPRERAFSGRLGVPWAPSWPSDPAIADPRAPIATPQCARAVDSQAAAANLRASTSKINRLSYDHPAGRRSAMAALLGQTNCAPLGRWTTPRLRWRRVVSRFAYSIKIITAGRRSPNPRRPIAVLAATRPFHAVHATRDRTRGRKRRPCLNE